MDRNGAVEIELLVMMDEWQSEKDNIDAIDVDGVIYTM